MSKELTKAEEKKLAKFSGLMDSTPVDSKDILLSKLLLMQPVSELVAQEKAKSGQIVGSVDSNILADKEETVEVILFGANKSWVKFKQTKGKPEFVSQEPFTVANASTPREELIDGEEHINYECINYFALLPQDIKEGNATPYAIQFRSTSYKTGKKLETCRAKLERFKKPLAFKTFKLGSKQVENDKGRFFEFTAEEGRDTTVDELEAVDPWFTMVQEAHVKVDNRDLEREVGTDEARADDTF